MERGLFSSNRMDWETPQALFDELNAEFGFSLDAAASESNAKCPRFFTERENGLIQSWGGNAFSAIRPTEGMSPNGRRRRFRNRRSREPLSFCSSRRERILLGFTISSGGTHVRFDSSGVA